MIRTKQHYDDLLERNPNSTVGFTLAANMLYAARHGVFNGADRSGDEWREIALRLKNKYGEALNPDEVKSEIVMSAAASLMGKKGGSAKSERKTQAVRENAKKGGRPRKQK